MSEDRNLLSSLPGELEPPASLEDQVVGRLKDKRLLGPGAARVGHNWNMPFLAVACVSMLAIGVLLGRASLPGTAVPAGTLTGAETDVYALLLYENETYDAPEGAELRSRYSEYSRWVAEARQREQFITGEDLEVREGWLMHPASEGIKVEPATSLAEQAALSGMFFIRADNPEHALELARELPHLKHGGQVLVQKTLPTVSPPGG